MGKKRNKAQNFNPLDIGVGGKRIREMKGNELKAAAAMESAADNVYLMMAKQHAKRKAKKDKPGISMLNDSEFMAYLMKTFPGGQIDPEPQDFDFEARAVKVSEQAEQFRLAQARRIIRLYAEWKANQN